MTTDPSSDSLRDLPMASGESGDGVDIIPAQPAQDANEATSHDRLLPRNSLPSPLPPAPLGRLQILSFLFKSTALYVATGMCIMLLGTLIMQVAILSKVYLCPPGATCKHHLDPQGKFLRINILSLTQSLTQYWLQLGCIISGIGILRLMAYRSWITMTFRGHTIQTLEQNFAAIKGSIFDAALLLLKGSNRSLGLFVIIQIIITTSISLIVGLSISPLTFPYIVEVDFHYLLDINIIASTAFIPPSMDNNYFAAIYKLNEWVISNDTTHGRSENLQGTLVVQDNRSVYGVNPQPGGLHIAGDVFCSSAGLHHEAGNNQTYLNMSSPLASGQVISLGTPILQNLYQTDPLKGFPYFSVLWFSSDPNLLPESIAFPNGEEYQTWYVTACNHTVHLDEISTTLKDVSILEPSFLGADYKLEGPDPNSSAVTISLVSAMLAAWWWGLADSGIPIPIACQNGALVPFFTADPVTQCKLSNETWSNTLAAVLDALVYTAIPLGNTTQKLSVETRSLNMVQWWLQAIIPCSIFLLYIACLAYTTSISHGLTDFPKELSMLEYTKVILEMTQTVETEQEELVQSTKIGAST